jgi:hypothetical protein
MRMKKVVGIGLGRDTAGPCHALTRGSITRRTTLAQQHRHRSELDALAAEGRYVVQQTHYLVTEVTGRATTEQSVGARGRLE